MQPRRHSLFEYPPNHEGTIPIFVGIESDIQIMLNLHPQEYRFGLRISNEVHMRYGIIVLCMALLPLVFGCGTGGGLQEGADSGGGYDPNARIGPNFESGETYSHTYSDGSTITNSSSHDNGVYSGSMSRTDPRGNTVTNGYNGQTNTYYSNTTRSGNSK